MRAVIQRVKWARVDVAGETVAQIGPGFLSLIGVEEGDAQTDMRYIAGKIATLRIFEDENEKMNLSLSDVGAEVLLVSQFTLLGDARHGRRPSFSRAARPEQAEPLFEQLADEVRASGLKVQTGRFRTHMQVSLLNDGPVTLLLDSKGGF